MSQQRSSGTQARNEDCRDIVSNKLTDLCCDNGFLCHDKAEEVHEEECCDISYSVATLIKKMAVEFCRNKRQLYHDIKW